MTAVCRDLDARILRAMKPGVRYANFPGGADVEAAVNRLIAKRKIIVEKATFAGIRINQYVKAVR